MGVVPAQIQTVEEIYRLVWTAVANKQPIEANYRAGIGCFVRTDWAGIGKGSSAYCATSTAAKARADCKRWARRPTGVVWRWRNSAG
jgi:hypothetical protein